MVLAYSIGTGKRTDTSINRTAQIVPGAGTYEQSHDLRKSAPKWGFGSGKRPGLNSGSVASDIGPG